MRAACLVFLSVVGGCTGSDGDGGEPDPDDTTAMVDPPAATAGRGSTGEPAGAGSMTMAPPSGGSTAPTPTDAAGTPSAPMCAQPGDDCPSTGECCAESTCVTDGTVSVCAADCTGHEQCQSGCCAPLLSGGSVCSPSEQCAVSCNSAGEDCSATDCCPDEECVSACGGGSICAGECTGDSDCRSGCCDSGVCQPPWVCSGASCGGPGCLGCASVILVADDGTFLGNASANPVAPDGVCNSVGPHGSTVAPASIFNSVGLYGSTVGPMSAYSSITPTPPVLLCEPTGEVLGAITKNTIITGGIDPDALCAMLDTNACL